MLFDIGDIVRVIRDWTDEEAEITWCDRINIDEFIGKEFTISTITPFHNYGFDCTCYAFPECVLELVPYPTIPEVLFVNKCELCGCEIPTEQQNPLCESCQENSSPCAKCGDIHLFDDMFLGCDEEYYCEDCYKERFIECYECGAVILRCNACSNNITDYYYCEQCYSDIFTTCDECSCDIRVDDAYSTEYGVYCEDCYDRQHSLLHEYGYHPNFKFYDMDNINYSDDKDVLYLGIELEVDDGDSANDFLESHESYFEELPIYFCHDGSLGDEGIEMITHPCTLSYHQSKIPYADIFKKFRSCNYLSHDSNTCGLHCHINRTYLGETPEERDINIAKILIFYERSWEQIIKFSRRTPSQYNQWCKRYAMETNNDDQIKELLDTAKNADRYYAVNLSNYNTIEFRVFRGTLNINTFMATLQFIESVIEFTKSIPISNHCNINWETYKEYILNKSVTYMTLINYLNTRGV